jgi:membrane protease YdiL (CAAX protease family)
MKSSTRVIPNRRLLLAYAIPYFVYVGIASLFAGHLPVELIYALRLLVVSGLIVWAWRWYVPLKGPKSPWASVATGTVAGLAGAAFWVALLWPFAAKNVEPWTDLAFVLRLVAAGMIVPVFEELLMRGFILRLTVQWDNARKEGEKNPLGSALDERSVISVKPGAWTCWAIAISTIAFTLGHHVREWPAAMVFGLLMAFLWIYRKDLLSCVTAHGVANITLALFVRATGNWGLW